MRRFSSAVFFLALLLPCFLAAQNVTGVVHNGTSNKPAAGVEVVLVDPMQGMAEVTKTRTDAQGKYSLPLGDAKGPRLVRATKDGANYFKMLTPGTTTADMEIYDAAKKVDGITGTVNVIRMQSDGSTLQVLELYALKNGSAPPRTMAGDNTFEVALPDGAQLDAGDAQGPNGQPLTLTPEPTKTRNHYAFSFPLRPGETRFQISYHLPYSGEITFTPHLLMPYDHVVLVTPQTMTFEAKDAAAFRPMPDQNGTNVQVANRTKAGQDLSFRVSGKGTIPEEQESAQGGQGGGQSTASTAANGRPGGGLGPPIDAPDPLTKYKWPLLGVFALVLAGGAYIMMTRPVPGAPTPSAQPKRSANAPAKSGAKAAAASSRASGNALLDAMREELFELEIERQQGDITPEEYAKQKAALDQTLQRALSRASKS